MLPVEITDAMLKVVQRYVDRKLTRAEAAARLQLSERQVTRIVEELGLERTKSVRAITEEQAALRRAAKEAAAAAFLKQQVTLAQAALRAGCHPRTIARLAERIKEARKKKR